MKMPVQYRMGRAYFMDFEFSVTPDTLIPRPETELLVEKAIEAAEGMRHPMILDIGTGSGNIAISLTKYLEECKITASDISGAALSVAAANSEALGSSGRIMFLRCDGLSAFKEKRIFDMVIANPPYVSEKDMLELPEEVRLEPREALYGGEDGMDFYRKIIGAAPVLIKEGGYILLELGYDQADKVRDMLGFHGFSDIDIYRDYCGIERIARARMK